MLRQLGLIILFFLASPLHAESTIRNKLVEMFRFFYLPFEVSFQVGESADEVIPFKANEIISPESMQKLDKKWTELRKEFRARSLFRDSKEAVNSTSVISPHLISHRITANRSALDALGIEERIRIKELLKGKSPEVQATVLQKQFIRSFINPHNTGKAHFFIVAPDWCASSENYRVLLETYAKRFALSKFVLHSVVIEDPKEQIFDSKAMNELFPFPKRYSHESVPRFLLAEFKNGELVVSEEGNALYELYEAHFAPHQGFLETENPLRSSNSKPTLSKLSFE